MASDFAVIFKCGTLWRPPFITVVFQALQLPPIIPDRSRLCRVACEFRSPRNGFVALPPPFTTVVFQALRLPAPFILDRSRLCRVAIPFTEKRFRGFTAPGTNFGGVLYSAEQLPRCDLLRLPFARGFVLSNRQDPRFCVGAARNAPHLFRSRF